MSETTLSKDECTKGLTTRVIGGVINFHDVVPSTNDLAQELARAGADEGTVVIARSQTGGKGRMGREFHSPEGGIYMSVVLRPSMTMEELSPLPLIIGLSVSKAIQCSIFKEAEVKWPNDVIVEGKKVAGILMGSAAKGERAEYVICGIGINLNSDMSDLPMDIRENAASLKDIIKETIDPNEFTRDLLYFLDLHYSRFREGQTEELLDQWTRRSSTVGSDVKVSTGDREVKGEALGVDQTGALMVNDGDSLLRVSSGDCTCLEEA